MTNEKKHGKEMCNCCARQKSGQQSPNDNKVSDACKNCSNYSIKKSDYEGSERSQSENETERGQEYNANQDLEETNNRMIISNRKNNQ